jgi:hypothetical protein
MQYQVPQFIEVEDKIFGPLTLRQFIYLAGSGGVCLIFFSLLPLWLTLILSTPVAIFGAGLAFYHINGRPLVVALEHGFAYFFGSKLYLWKQREPKTPEASKAIETRLSALPVPKLSESKLRDLSWSLNIKDRSKMGVVDVGSSRGFEI